MRVVDEQEGSAATATEPAPLVGLMVSPQGLRIKIFADSVDEESAAWALLQKLTPQISLLRSAIEAK